MEKTQYSTSVNNNTFNSEKFDDSNDLERNNPLRVSGNKKRNKATNKYKNNIPKNLLSDLESTYELNIEILKTFYNTSNSKKSKNDKEDEILKAIESIKKTFLSKKELVSKIKEVKSKILIELQIYGEKKRKVEEMKDVYAEQTGDNENNLLNKEENISKIRKKLKEVEIYIHKLSLNIKDKNRAQGYKNFLINEFLDNNNELCHRKQILKNQVEKAKLDLETASNENKTIKKENGFNNINGDDGKKKEDDKNENKNNINSKEMNDRMNEKYLKKEKLIN